MLVWIQGESIKWCWVVNMFSKALRLVSNINFCYGKYMRGNGKFELKDKLINLYKMCISQLVKYPVSIKILRAIRTFLLCPNVALLLGDSRKGRDKLVMMITEILCTPDHPYFLAFAVHANHRDHLLVPLSRSLTWRRQGLWPIQQPATRGLSRWAHFPFRSCHVVHLDLQSPAPVDVASVVSCDWINLYYRVHFFVGSHFHFSSLLKSAKV